MARKRNAMPKRLLVSTVERMLNSGHGPAFIADRLGYTPRRIQQLMREHGLAKLK